MGKVYVEDSANLLRLRPFKIMFGCVFVQRNIVKWSVWLECGNRRNTFGED
jgi:hypothetical protein